ncbi:TetR/AcrR family transcriptional regulator [Actinokineospora auranticolor]|uniref:Regulatory TetR family protein n=1 Tax=Actinokineospora auranticolor TaxID=155976 RepID=A0A2S6GWX1_9PSEU|nr:TetR/AcrR family transcriptional regulator [Actinokineospora auranticolor]PPK69709.1 regulatory TetR family protein [Actinokineospora auranticolor]
MPSEETDTSLPASVEAVWGLRGRPARGPKRALSLERIVAAGVAVADREGLDALSMSRVANAIGTSAMSLYRYVSAKDELLTLMVDAVYADTWTIAATGRWRADLTQLAFNNLHTLRRHPWVVRVPVTGPPITPHQLRWLEASLAALRGTPLSGKEKIAVMLLVNSLVRNDATLMIDLRVGEPESEGKLPDYGKTLRLLLDPKHFPELIDVLDEGVFDYDDTSEQDFSWSLERALDGVAALIESKR